MNGKSIFGMALVCSALAVGGSLRADSVQDQINFEMAAAGNTFGRLIFLNQLDQPIIVTLHSVNTKDCADITDAIANQTPLRYPNGNTTVNGQPCMQYDTTSRVWVPRITELVAHNAKAFPIYYTGRIVDITVSTTADPADGKKYYFFDNSILNDGVKVKNPVWFQPFITFFKDQKGGYQLWGAPAPM